MRQDTKITTVYRFEELSEKAQKKALEKLRDINVDYEWWDSAYDDAANVGVKIKGFDLGQARYCKGAFTQDERDVAESILANHGKDRETYSDAYEFIWELALAEDEYHQELRAQEEDDFDADYECPELLEEFRLTIFEDYRVILQKEYDYLIGEEAIKDTINANEYEFTEDGRIYR